MQQRVAVWVLALAIPVSLARAQACDPCNRTWSDGQVTRVARTFPFNNLRCAGLPAGADGFIVEFRRPGIDARWWPVVLPCTRPCFIADAIPALSGTRLARGWLGPGARTGTTVRIRLRAYRDTPSGRLISAENEEEVQFCLPVTTCAPPPVE